ncbi:hypothetical protein SBY92_002117 [Candida maltosa Xu316]
MRDGVFTYVHLSDANKVLYMERWKDEPIPFDDIDVTNLIEAAVNVYPQLFADEEEEDGMISFPSQQFGSKSYKNRRSIKQKKWMDLNLDSFFQKTQVVDKTLVPPVANDPDLADFLNNGYNKEDDISLNSTSDYAGNSNNTFLNLRSNSNNQQFQTPRPGRVRQVSTDKFQTPVGRIMR